MPYSNPVIKEIIRERLTDMVLKRLHEADLGNGRMGPPGPVAGNVQAAGRASKEAGRAAGRAAKAATGQVGTKAANVARQIGAKVGTIGPSVDAAAKTANGAKLMKFGKFGGPLIGAAVQGLDSASTEWSENKEKGLGDTENAIKTGVRGVAGAGGAGLGVWGGAAAGAALGSVVPGIGTVIGGIVGGIAGGIGGGWLGDKVGDAVTNIGEDPAAQRKFKQDAKNAEGDERQKRADDRWSSKFGSSSDNGFGDAPRPGGNGQRSSGGSYRGGGGRGGRGQSQEFSIGGAGSVDFSASQTQWDNDNSNYNGDDGYDGGGQGGGGGRGAEGENPRSNGVTRYPTPGINFGGPITSDSLGLNKPSASSKSSNGVTKYTDIDFGGPELENGNFASGTYNLNMNQTQKARNSDGTIINQGQEQETRLQGSAGEGDQYYDAGSVDFIGSQRQVNGVNVAQDSAIRVDNPRPHPQGDENPLLNTMADRRRGHMTVNLSKTQTDNSNADNNVNPSAAPSAAELVQGSQVATSKAGILTGAAEKLRQADGVTTTGQDGSTRTTRTTQNGNETREEEISQYDAANDPSKKAARKVMGLE